MWASFHGGGSSLGLGLGLVLWKQLEVCDTRGSRWKYVGAYGSSLKLPRNIFVEAAIDGSSGASTSTDSGNSHVLPRKLPLTLMGSKSNSINFHVSLEINRK